MPEVRCAFCGARSVGDTPELLNKAIEIHKRLCKARNKPSEIQPVCPECGSMISHQEGCLVCYCCGWNRCG